jgi:uncharacterized protein
VRLVSLPDGPALLRAAGEWLSRAEAEHCYLLGAGGSPRLGAPGPGRLFLVLEDEDADEAAGAALQVPPGPLALSHLQEAPLALLVQWLREHGLRPAHVLGPADTVERFAARWTQVSGTRVVPVMRQGVYALTRVLPPPHPAEGHLREAGPQDAPRIADWAEAFAHESGLPGAERAAMRRASAGWLAERTAWVWECGGAPVGMAVAQGPTSHGIRVGMVYTPPAQRGRGYASALVAALSQHQLDLGRRACFLFTDLANPTSNGIYRAVGYTQVGEARLVRFEPSA